MTDQAELERLRSRTEQALAPCLWHGESSGTPQPRNGVAFCAQCERRQDPLCVRPALLATMFALIDPAHVSGDPT